MTDKYQNRYRIPSTRMQNWDYSWNASYFITICTRRRIHYFGEIMDGTMQLSEIGQMAENFWFEIPEHFPFVVLDAFVVMPNHIHGIITIAKTDTECDNVGNGNMVAGCDNVETQNFASLSSPPSPSFSSSPPLGTQSQPKNKFGAQSKNLASIVRGYKIGVTKHAKTINPGWAWQSRYYDHVIRDGQSYQRIKQYIISNPQNWNNDKFYDKTCR